jgi:hypothetical protein
LQITGLDENKVFTLLELFFFGGYFSVAATSLLFRCCVINLVALFELAL